MILKIQNHLRFYISKIKGDNFISFYSYSNNIFIEDIEFDKTVDYYKISGESSYFLRVKIDDSNSNFEITTSSTYVNEPYFHNDYDLVVMDFQNYPSDSKLTNVTDE